MEESREERMKSPVDGFDGVRDGAHSELLLEVE